MAQTRSDTPPHAPGEKSPKPAARRESGLHWLLRHLQHAVAWLAPGLGIKRWLLLILLGTTLLGLGFAVLVLDFYRTAPETWWLPALSFASLRFLARPLRALIFGGMGLGCVVVGIWQLNRALLKPFLRPGTPIIETVSAYRKRDRGPRTVVIGGGTGMAMLLRGLKAHTHNLTAIVTVADDGGSSGMLRRSLGVLPPGDIRNCLAALSNDETLMTQLFQYRFPSGNGLGGHSLGNLLITALAEITGSFEEGIAESGRVLAVQGQVLPSTLHDVRLVADVVLPEEGSEVRVRGESRIPEVAGRIRRVWLEPNNPLAYPPAIQAILNAELIIVGPGSLFTSILPNLLVTDLLEAVRSSRALKFYVCNVATQPGETNGFTAGEHIRTIEQHTNGNLFDLMICNNRFNLRSTQQIEWVRPERDLDEHYSVYYNDLVDPDNPRRHHSERLAQIIMDLFFERTGPLSGKEPGIIEDIQQPF
ncbi:MAG TPA: gluconeogenesis factor YvcK family protein [Anaerolineaceae bacterium]